MSAGRRTPGPARLVRQDRPLPETVDAADVEVFLADLNTHRDRAITLAMLLGGLRAGEVRGLRLADVDMGMRQVTVVGKGNKTGSCRSIVRSSPRSAPISTGNDHGGLSTPECFVVLRGPTTGQAMTEAGLRKIFRTHRARTGAIRVRPHRLRHTFGTDLAVGGHRRVGAARADGPRPRRDDHGVCASGARGDRCRVGPSQGGQRVTAVAVAAMLARPSGWRSARRLRRVRRRDRGRTRPSGHSADVLPAGSSNVTATRRRG